MKRYLSQVVVFVAVFAAVVGYGQFCEWQVARAEAAAPVALSKAFAREEGVMADWTVTDAGDATYNGIFTLAGTHNEAPYYVKGEGAAARYLYSSLPDPDFVWGLGPAFGEAIYYGASNTALPANDWSVGTGTPPAPTVAACAPTSFTPVGFFYKRTGDDSAGVVAVIINGVNNTSEEVKHARLIQVTWNEPNTVIDGSVVVDVLPGTGKTVASGPTITGLCNLTSYIFLWAEDDTVTVDLDGDPGFEVLNWVWPWSTSSNVPRWEVTLGQIPAGPSYTTQVVSLGEGEKLSSYSTLLDAGEAVAASSISVLQRVTASFASGYTTTARPYVYARSSYGVLGAVSAEAASAYSTRGTVANKVAGSSYGVLRDAGDAAFASAYTIESGGDGGPVILALLMAAGNVIDD